MEKKSGHLFGRTLRTATVRGLLLTESAYPAGYSTPRHSHEFACFCFVLSGTITERHGSRQRWAQPSSLVYHPLDEDHSEKFVTSARLFSIAIGEEWNARLESHTARQVAPAEFHDGLPSLLTLRLYREFRHMDFASPLAIEGLALELVAECSRALRRDESGSPRWLEKIREFLSEGFSEPFSLSQLAAMVDVHPAHLARTFRARFGCTIGDHVRRLRIQSAARQLACTNLPLVDVALDAGFNNQSHFSTVFKQLTGMTPLQYRTLNRANRKQIVNSMKDITVSAA